MHKLIELRIHKDDDPDEIIDQAARALRLVPHALLPERYAAWLGENFTLELSTAGFFVTTVYYGAERCFRILILRRGMRAREVMVLMLRDAPDIGQAHHDLARKLGQIIKTL